MGEREMRFRILVGKPEGKRPMSSDLDVGGKVILKFVWKKWDGWHGLD
jgi:hypothetical protein